MKKKVCLLLILFFVPIANFAITVQKDTFADVKVFVTSSAAEADLVVYVDPSFPEHNQEEIWQWTQSFPDLKIALTDDRSYAKLKVFFASSRGEAKWNNPSHPLKGRLIK